MLSDNEVDSRVLNYRALSPTEREAFKQEVVRRAYAERDAAIRTVSHGLWSGLLAYAGLVQAGVAFRNLWTAYRKGRERKTAINELFALDDHMLKDMGISRSEIIAVVHAEHNSRLPPAMTPTKGRDRINKCVSQSSARAPQASILPI